MGKIYLPTLNSIKIKNFSLYPNGLDFEFDFINGVNLIIGGNGMGKTTFVNIIKYSIIGHYKKDFDFSRTYKERAISKRILYPINYYKNRLDESLNLADKPTVILEFKINETTITIERSLEDVSILSLFKDEYQITGEIISDFKYDELVNDHRKEQNKEKKIKLFQELEKTLPYKYEQEIELISGRTFDDLIFFVNEILYFGEEHKTILWNDGKSGPNVQNELFNKYFNAPELDRERKEADRQSKYFDSISRHKSEDIRAIRRVLDKVNKDNSPINEDSINQQILILRNSIQNIESKLENIQSERALIEDEIGILNNKVNEHSNKESEIEQDKKLAENKMLEGKWLGLHKNYDIYIQNIRVNGACPMCNKTLEKEFIEHKISHTNNCFVCDQEIVKIDNKELNENFSAYNTTLKDLYNKILNFQKQIREKDSKLKILDSEFRNAATNKSKFLSELRSLEYNKSKGEAHSEDKLQAFYDEIELLDSQKNEFQDKSKIEKEKADYISSKIEEHIKQNTNKFSILFAEFAEKFLGVKCSLSFTSIGDGNSRFYPIIDGKIRHNEEELSESQRFFVDHSFRMSILSFFYTKPTFYIVETPDSSLDISYESNAADVFIKFLEKPNCLILTTNLNNSEFLTLLVKNTKVSIINLLEIGRQSVIQSSSESLRLVYQKLKNNIKNE